MQICYLDESGTPEVPGTSSHFVLVGLSMPIAFWREADGAITNLLKVYGLEDAEIHTAWLMRPYLEQSKIPNFASLPWQDRRREVGRLRNAELLRLQRAGGKPLSRTKKFFKATESYIHLSLNERTKVVQDIAKLIASWTDCRIFSEAINKLHFDPVRTGKSVGEQAFEQVISRFHHYLNALPDVRISENYGILVHDNNQTVAKKHTELMRRFHASGTLYTQISKIIETPLFVDSGLTRMVQMADLCSYAIRRFTENAETDLFMRIFPRFDISNGKAVSVRHFAGRSCQCTICDAHHRGILPVS